MEGESSSVAAGPSTVDVSAIPEVIGDTKAGEESVKVVAAAAVAAFRNVNTQHGDYRSVDEENIVVFRVCHSPEPKPVLAEDGQEQPVVWIEEFVSPENEVSAANILR
nr:uncharacterized protein LOC109420646 [Aedes albopictus]